MSTTTPPVRRFTPGGEGGPIRFGDHRIVMTPAVEAAEGGPLSTYSAFFGAGESADLPAPYDEVWVVIRGKIVVGEPGRTVSGEAGDHLHVPRDSPGTVEAIEDTELVCVSVPAH
ncbi:cupin [Crossiella sp. CA-258035]|uniref:cupin n=1 Tax=Crossiella sp. CA-258035 TaxID=2981138 RepID=UPI0024BCEFE1|nr:cupin [Crossiella sp. CA-258035]WHT16962.1 cupin [Crossiella sp. CA-258035]